jgi:PTH1 family peptidyl-tRNA hydrolase
MKIIVGLGNVGKEYNWTRHNFGFLALDFFAKQADLEWKNEPKFKAMIAKSSDLLLAKPQTFYNASGEAVQNLVKFYKTDTKHDLLVICDDLNLDFGALRLRETGSDGGNNGLKSIITFLGAEFPRLRLGTDNPKRSLIGDTDFVLSKFSDEEKAKLPEILTETSEFITNFINRPRNNK